MESPKPISLDDFRKRKKEKIDSEKKTDRENSIIPPTQKPEPIRLALDKLGSGHSTADMFNIISRELRLGKILEGIDSEKIALLRQMCASTIITSESRATAQRILADYTLEEMMALINNSSEFEIKKKPVLFVRAFQMLESI